MTSAPPAPQKSMQTASDTEGNLYYMVNYIRAYTTYGTCGGVNTSRERRHLPALKCAIRFMNLHREEMRPQEMENGVI